MKNTILNALKKHAEGHIAKHLANVEIYLKQSVGIGEHPDILEAIEKELEEIAKYQDQLDVINLYFTEDKTLINENTSIA
tara:strand:- start:13361 stop:13600 length:240 start_codon:yes stop_codon:yes gene_type:complete